MENEKCNFFVIGELLQVSPVEAVENYPEIQKRRFVVKTSEEFNNLKVFELSKSKNHNKLNLADEFRVMTKDRPGELVKVFFNWRCVKSKAGIWFNNIAAWKIESLESKANKSEPEPEGYF